MGQVMLYKISVTQINMSMELTMVVSLYLWLRRCLEILIGPISYHQGWSTRAVSDTTHTVLSRPSKPLSMTNTTTASAPFSIAMGRDATSNQILVQMPPNGTTEVKASLALFSKITPNNTLQSAAAVSHQAYQPGEFPNALIDVVISTFWQPANSQNQQA